ncbi:MAG: hypothetical protein R3B54_10070 [Bdellovibrionota bacterium]
MQRDELQFRALDAEARFEYQFALLIFATLTLSIQFSPPMGASMRCLLIAAWLFFLVAGVVAGWRLSKLPLAYRLNWGELTQAELVKNRKSQLAEPTFTRGLAAGRVLDADTKQPMTLSDYTSMVEESEKNLKEITSRREALSRCYQIAFWAQILLFLAGIVCNGIFLGMGLLEKTP